MADSIVLLIPFPRVHWPLASGCNEGHLVKPMSCLSCFDLFDGKEVNSLLALVEMKVSRTVSHGSPDRSPRLLTGAL